MITVTYIRRLIGPQASIIIGIVNTIGSASTLQIRLRGVGSGFREGPNQTELPEPLHFVVSAADQNLLQRAVEKVKELVESVRSGMRTDDSRN